jgi:CRP-like cAMP-binding protein
MDEEEEIKDFLKFIPKVKKIKFFKEQNLNDEDLHTVCCQLEELELPAGKDVFKYGYYGDQFYIILSGQVSVLVPKKKTKGKKENLQKKVIK